MCVRFSVYKVFSVAVLHFCTPLNKPVVFFYRLCQLQMSVSVLNFQYGASSNSGAVMYKHCAFCEESTKLTGCVDFDTSTNIRYGATC